MIFISAPHRGQVSGSYLQALDAILEDSGQAALDKAFEVAVYERHRYFANRIAQTELHRAHTDQRARVDGSGRDRGGGVSVN